MEAALGQHIDSMEVLVELKASVNHESKTEKTALLEASLHGKENAVETLARLNCLLDQETSQGHTALEQAASSGKLNVVAKLLSLKANGDYQTKTGNTAMGVAAFNGHMEAIDILLQGKADPGLETKRGCKSPLLKAVQNNQVMMVHHLARPPIEVNLSQEMRDGNTALMLAAGEGRVKVIKALVTAKAPVDYESSVVGKTALGHASMIGNTAAINELAQQRADLNLENQFGRTPLLCAVMCGQQKSVLLLLRLRATPDYMTSSGQSALACAKNMKNHEATQALQKALFKA